MVVNSTGPADWQKISDIIRKSGYALDQYGNRMPVADALSGLNSKQIEEIITTMGPGTLAGAMSTMGGPHTGAAQAGGGQKAEAPSAYGDFIRALKATSASTYGGNLNAAIDDAFFRRAVLEARLRKIISYEGFTTAQAGDDIVIFFVRNGEVFLIRDPAAVYPSDALVAKLKLLEDKP